MVDVEAVLTAMYRELLPCLDERQQRMALGAGARALGRGGIAAMARVSGASEARVSRGAAELSEGAPVSDRTRREGAGRKRLTDLDPGLRPALLALVEPDERGDPVSPLRWTTKSLSNLADELARQGHRVGRDTVAVLLREAGFSLQGTSRTTEGARHPDRDAQFRYINERAREFLDAGDPVVSIDAKKKEQVGDFHQEGREWRPKGEPIEVRSHDFPDKQLGKVIPYGVYDLARNTGWVGVGIDHDTAAFAVATLRRWWGERGRHDYPNARRLLITADAGGSNGYRVRAWKTELAAFAVEAGLQIVVCHFPPGTSKWNKIEHRLFCHITRGWRGRPLTSHEVVVETIAATTTSTGLAVHAELDTRTYPAGVVVSDEELATVALEKHEWHGEWNYTVHPHPKAATPPVDDAPTGRFPETDRAPDWLRHPTLTGMEAPVFAELLAAFEQHLREHPTVTFTVGRPKAHTGLRLLTPADRLLVTVVNLRWKTHLNTLAHLLGVSKSTIGGALRETKQDLKRMGRTIPAAPITATDTTALRTLIGLPSTTDTEDRR